MYKVGDTQIFDSAFIRKVKFHIEPIDTDETPASHFKVEIVYNSSEPGLYSLAQRIERAIRAEIKKEVKK